MRRSPRSSLILCLLIIYAATPGAGAQAATWLQDTWGLPAPPVVYQGTGGAQTIVNDTDRLPVNATGPATSSSTDPTGWGKVAYASPTVPSCTAAVVGAFTTDQTVLLFCMTDGAPSTVQTWTSNNGGRTFVLTSTSSTTFGVATLYTATYFSGAFLVGTGGVLRSTDGLTWTILTLTGCVGCVASDVVGQGTTVLASAGAAGQIQICRSTNSGASFPSCVDPAAVGVINPNNQPGGLASPSAGIWLVGDGNGDLARSTDDGLTWIQVLATTSAQMFVTCLSATVCVATDGGTIYQSTNAGATWTAVAALGASVGLDGFLNFGSGVVVAMSGTNPEPFFRSGDFGATWALQGNLPTASMGNFAARLARNGRGLLTQLSGNTNIIYFPIAEVGTVVVRSANGTPLNLDANGNPTANQGAAAAATAGWPVKQDTAAGPTLAPWSVAPVQGFTLFNSQTTGAANTAVTTTLTGAASTRTHLYSAEAYCSAGTANLTVQDGAGTIYQTPAGAVGTSPFRREWPVGLTATTANNLVVTLGACGAANTGTLSVQGDRF